MTSLYLVRYVDVFREKKKICFITDYCGSADLSHLVEGYIKEKNYIPENVYNFFVNVLFLCMLGNCSNFVSVRPWFAIFT
jgi:hypothetical protein